MLNLSKKYFYHFSAILTVSIWGTTFVSTKILIGNGLSPVEILIYRFLMAYLGIWFLRPRKLFAQNIKDELLFLALGLCGGSLYFILENTALQITLASNVSLIVCTAPIFTTFLSYFIYRNEKIKAHLLAGSFIALFGVGLVVFNGSFILKLNPVGDLLTILAALSWAFYGIILLPLNGKYPIVFVTRKVFFYGIVTILPILYLKPDTIHLSLLSVPSVIANLVFLGLIASLACFIMWNTAVKKLGVVETSNYIYFVPLVTLFTSAIVIDEKITIIALAGSIFIIIGVYIAEKGFRFKKNKSHTD